MSEDLPERTRIRVSIQAGELEVEGSEAFVSQYADAFDSLIDRVRSATGKPGRSSGGGLPDDTRQEVDEFPEALHRLSSGSGTDQILLAGSYARANHSDGSFSTNEANALLVGQGVKLANPSQSMANNLKAKRVFKSGKSWKISRAGDEYLRTLI